MSSSSSQSWLPLSPKFNRTAASGSLIRRRRLPPATTSTSWRLAIPLSSYSFSIPILQMRQLSSTPSSTTGRTRSSVAAFLRPLGRCVHRPSSAPVESLYAFYSWSAGCQEEGHVRPTRLRCRQAQAPLVDALAIHGAFTLISIPISYPRRTCIPGRLASTRPHRTRRCSS